MKFASLVKLAGAEPSEITDVVDISFDKKAKIFGADINPEELEHKDWGEQQKRVLQYYKEKVDEEPTKLWKALLGGGAAGGAYVGSGAALGALAGGAKGKGALAAGLIGAIPGAALGAGAGAGLRSVDKGIIEEAKLKRGDKGAADEDLVNFYGWTKGQKSSQEARKQMLKSRKQRD